MAAAGDAAGGAPSPSAATYRRPPRPPAFINTFRIEEMLRAAMQAAEHDVSRAATFERVLGRYRQHPGVLRRRREREAARRAEHERTSRAFYWAERRRVPEGVHHRLSSLDELVDAGCSWEVATELMRFPMLKLLRYDAKRLMALPAHELVMFNLDRRMGESHARAAIYLASDAFGGLRIASSASRLAAGATQQKGGRALVADWLETQHRIFEEMSERGFAPPTPPARPVAAPPAAKATKAAHPAANRSPLRDRSAAQQQQPQPQQSQQQQQSPPPPPPPPPPQPVVTAAPPVAVAPPAAPAAATVDHPPSTPPPRPPPIRTASVTSSSDPAARVDEVELADTAASLATTVDVPPSGGVCATPLLSPAAAQGDAAAPPSPPLTALAGAAAAASGIAPASAEDLATELDEPLGQGTYGVVYRGRRAGRHVAVKILSLSVETAKEVQAEINILRACACDHIVGYISAFRRALDGRQALWVVMELAEHGSTHDLMKRRGGALDEATVAWVCAGVLRALHHMHTVVRAIHRDVKAANVLVVRGGAIKLADLGVAAQLQRTLSKRGTMIGTPHWLAPEALAPGLEQPAAGGGGDGGGGDVAARRSRWGRRSTTRASTSGRWASPRSSSRRGSRRTPSSSSSSRS